VKSAISDITSSAVGSGAGVGDGGGTDVDVGMAVDCSGIDIGVAVGGGAMMGAVVGVPGGDAAGVEQASRTAPSMTTPAVISFLIPILIAVFTPISVFNQVLGFG
jgi:hypothetical protein